MDCFKGRVMFCSTDVVLILRFLAPGEVVSSLEMCRHVRLDFMSVCFAVRGSGWYASRELMV